MDKRIRAQSTMQIAVSALLDTYDDVLNEDADFLASEGLRQVALGKFRAASRRAGAVDTMIHTGNKEAEKARVIREILKPLGRVHAWADRSGDALLRGKVDFSFSDLDDVPDAEIIARLEGLLTVVRGVVVQVPSIPSARLDALDDELDDLEALIGSPRSQKVDRGAALGEMEAAIKEANAVLTNQHDKIVRDFAHAAPATPAEVRQRELFDRWALARTIVNAGTRSAEPGAAGGAAAASG